MFNLGMGEITVILLLALIFLGPKKLPELASGLGKLIREIRKTTSDVKNEIQLDDAIRKPFEELRDAVTLHPEELKRRDRLKRELADLQREAEAAIAAAEANASQSPEEAPVLPDSDSAASLDHAASSEAGADSAAVVTPPGAPQQMTVGAASSAADPNAGLATPAPVVTTPAKPVAAPAGTIARTPSGPHGAPPAPPLAAVLARGTTGASTGATSAGAPGATTVAAAATGDKKPAQPPSGSDFVRALRAVPDGKRPIPGRSAPVGPAANSAADRGNTTQALTEADLAAITVGPPPPPPAPIGGHAGARPLPPSSPPPRLPGTTPPKTTET